MRTVIIADQNPAHRNYIRWGFNDLDTVFLEAEDGEEVVHLLEEGPVDLLVMNTRLRTVSGWEALIVVTDDDNWPDLSVLMYSNTEGPESAALKTWGWGANYMWFQSLFDLLGVGERAKELLSPSASP